MRRLVAGLGIAAASAFLAALAPAAPADKKADPKAAAPAAPADKKADPKAAAPADKKAPPPEKPKELKPDVIRMKDKTEVKGKVTKIDADGVTYDSQGKTVTLKHDEYNEVVLSDTPTYFSSGKVALNGRNYLKAVEDLQTALGEVDAGRARPLHKPAILFLLAQALDASGDSTKALETLKKLIDEFGNSRHRQDAFRYILDIARRKKDAAGSDQVQKILEDMKKEPEPLRGEAELVIGQAALDKQDYGKAQDIFTRLSANTAQPYAGDAKLGVLRCLRAQKKTDDLDKACKAVLANKAGSTMALLQFAGAVVAEAIVAKAEKDESLWRDARDACAQVVALGPPYRDESPDDYASALVNSGRCYLALAEGKSAKPDQKQAYKDRAVGYFTEASRFYKTTEWGKAADKELAKLGVGEKPKEDKKDEKKDKKDEKKDEKKDASK